MIWVTGLSGAGKSTLALELARRLRAKGEPCVVIDGDEIRKIFDDSGERPGSHGRDSRVRFGFRYSRLSQLISGQGVTTIVSTISLVREIHQWNRVNISRYLEIYLKVPLDELCRRDPKGIYRRYRAGEITDVWGMDLPIDEPENPDLVVEYSPTQTVEAIADLVMALPASRIKR